MRIRNRSTHYSSSPFLPSPPPSNAHNINLPKLALPDPSPASVAAGRASAPVSEGVIVSEGGCETRESSRGTHPPAQIECFLPRPQRGGKDTRRPSLGSSVGEGDGGKVVVSRPVEMEAWQNGARKLSARSGKTEGASHGGLKEELVSHQDSKGSRRRREKGERTPGPVKKRKRDIDREWKIDDDELLATRTNIKRKQRGNVTIKEQAPQVEHEDKREEEDASDTDTTSAAKHRRNGKNGSNKTKTEGHVFIEGSRCSRINGRGWRCSQQTLVGYSLCEHHLGKGRLKSMGSLRGRQSAASRMSQTDMINENNHMSLISPVDNIGEDQKPLIEAMKGHARKNIGSVKARSMSSLLGVNIANGSSPLISTSTIGGVAAGIDASNSEYGASPIPG